ncbi:MAG: phosphotransferase, partial [Deltaproteobacteria bacterium]|nr:phosphotransferase [Deltaproteobacteria bacterium]
MSARKMHDDEVDIDVALVRRLLTAQFPQWAGLPLDRVDSSGTANAVYRLGHDMAVRLPRHESSVGQVEKEQRWLPRLGPHLPLAVPVPLATGRPAEGYAWPWSVCRWLPGENATRETLTDLREAATALAGFATALQQIEPADGPSPGKHNFYRGVPLSFRAAYTEQSIAASEGLIDTD